MGSDYKKGLTIERIDNNGNYCKENCKWATRKQQNRNTRVNKLIEYKGVKKPLAQWAEEARISFSAFRSRYYRGWNLERMMSNKLERPLKIIK